MVNRSKARGTAAESAVVTYFRQRGWPFAERRSLSGQHDKGDLAGIHGIAGAAVLEVKVTVAQLCDLLAAAGYRDDVPPERAA